MRRRRLGRTEILISELGFGAASLGNLYQAITDAAAEAAIETAVAQGVTYFDTAPYYGFGLSERRVGDALRGRTDVVLSTKVGRLLRPVPQVDPQDDRQGFRTPMPFEPTFDYSYDGVMRSFEDSRHRLGLSRIDILYIHDIGAGTHGAEAPARFAQLIRSGGLRALEELRDADDISAFGLGVNEWEVCVEVTDHAEPDVFLLAGRYTLLEQTALETFFPLCERRGISVIVGGPFNSGILATGTTVPNPHYNYAPAPPEILERVAAFERVCLAHAVPLAAAALQFPLAHPAVASVIPGAAGSDQVEQAVALLRQPIPAPFWADLKSEGLVSVDAPVPDPTAA